MNRSGSWGVALALLATSGGCGSDAGGEPAPGAGGEPAPGVGGSGGVNPQAESGEDDLENCRLALPAWTAERELTGNGALFHFTIVDERVYYAAGTELYSDTFPAAAAAGAEELLRSYPSVGYFVSPEYVGYGSGPVPMQQITLVPRAGGEPTERPIARKAWATQGMYHAATDSLYGVVPGDTYSYFIHGVASGVEQIITTTSPSELVSATLAGDYLYATLEQEGQPHALFRFALGATEAQPVPVDVNDFVILAKDSGGLILRELEAGELVNRYYRLPLEGGTAQSIDLGEEGLEGVYSTASGLFINTQLRPGLPVNVRLLPAGGVETSTLWSTTYECRNRGMFVDGGNLYVGLRPNVKNWLVTIPLASLNL